MNKSRFYAVLKTIIFISGSIFILSSCGPAKPAEQKPQAAQKGVLPAVTKKVISKGMGALTVKITNSKKAPISLVARAFKQSDSRSSSLTATFSTNMSQELSPGTYDIEVNTTPQRIYKGIRVSEGRESVEDIGCMTGSVMVRAFDSKKKNASYPVRIMQTGTKVSAGNAVANRSFETMPGLYDVEIGVVPAMLKKSIKVDAGKEVFVDIGCVTGDLMVKCADENKKEHKLTVKVKKAGTPDMVASGLTNRAIELVQGYYDIEVASNPVQSNKGVSVKSGSETVMEVTVPSVPAPSPQAPGKTVFAPPVKKK